MRTARRCPLWVRLRMAARHCLDSIHDPGSAPCRQGQSPIRKRSAGLCRRCPRPANPDHAREGMRLDAESTMPRIRMRSARRSTRGARPSTLGPRPAAARNGCLSRSSDSPTLHLPVSKRPKSAFTRPRQSAQATFLSWLGRPGHPEKVMTDGDGSHAPTTPPSRSLRSGSRPRSCRHRPEHFRYHRKDPAR